MDSKTEEKALKYWLIFAAVLALLAIVGVVDFDTGKSILGASFVGIIIAGFAMYRK